MKISTSSLTVENVKNLEAKGYVVIIDGDSEFADVTRVAADNVGNASETAQEGL